MRLSIGQHVNEQSQFSGGTLAPIIPEDHHHCRNNYTTTLIKYHKKYFYLTKVKNPLRLLLMYGIHDIHIFICSRTLKQYSKLVICGT